MQNLRGEGIHSREALGFAVALSYACVAATRDVYLGGLVQRVSPSAVALVAFGASTSILLPIALARRRDSLAILWRQRRLLLWVNITSAVGWLAFLGSLRLIEPCLVQILYFGVGPLSVVSIDRYLSRAAPGVPLTRAERPIFIGLLISLVFASVVAVNGLSGMETQPVGNSMLGVILAIAGGVAMSVSILQCRRLNDAGIGPGVMFSVRYPMTALAAGILAFMSPAGILDTAPWISVIMAIAVLLILVPSYINQFAISLASPLTVRVVMAGAPVIVLLLEAIEGRLSPSLYSLVAAVFYGVFAISAGLARQRAIQMTEINGTNRNLEPSSHRQPLSTSHDWSDTQVERPNVIPVSEADRGRDPAEIPGISNWRRNYPL